MGENSYNIKVGKYLAVWYGINSPIGATVRLCCYSRQGRSELNAKYFLHNNRYFPFENIFTTRQRRYGKVFCLSVYKRSVMKRVWWRGGLKGCVLKGWGEGVVKKVRWGMDDEEGGEGGVQTSPILTSSGSLRSGGCEPYWNAFLLNRLNRKFNETIGRMFYCTLKSVVWTFHFPTTDTHQWRYLLQKTLNTLMLTITEICT